jgi:hypothetical protein
MYCIPLSSWSVRPPFVFIIPSSTCQDHILRTGSKYSFKYGARTGSTYFRYEANYTLFVVVPIYRLSLSRTTVHSLRSRTHCFGNDINWAVPVTFVPIPHLSTSFGACTRNRQSRPALPDSRSKIIVTRASHHACHPHSTQ